MLIHGYGQDGRSDFNRDVKNALLAQGDYNVIVGNFSNQITSGETYTSCFKSTGRQQLAQATRQQETTLMPLAGQLQISLTGCRSDIFTLWVLTWEV